MVDMVAMSSKFFNPELYMSKNLYMCKLVYILEYSQLLIIYQNIGKRSPMLFINCTAKKHYALDRRNPIMDIVHIHALLLLLLL